MSHFRTPTLIATSRRLGMMLVLVLALVVAGCATAPEGARVERLTPEQLAALKPVPNPKVSLDEIVALSRSGSLPAAIIERLASTGTWHALSPQQIIELNQQGVDRSVIEHLAAAEERARQATLITQLADRDAKAARDLARERAQRQALQQRYNNWHGGIGYGSGGPFTQFGWRSGGWPGYYYDPFFRSWRPRW